MEMFPFSRCLLFKTVGAVLKYSCDISVPGEVCVLVVTSTIPRHSEIVTFDDFQGIFRGPAELAKPQNSPVTISNVPGLLVCGVKAAYRALARL